MRWIERDSEERERDASQEPTNKVGWLNLLYPLSFNYQHGNGKSSQEESVEEFERMPALKINSYSSLLL